MFISQSKAIDFVRNKIPGNILAEPKSIRTFAPVF